MADMSKRTTAEIVADLRLHPPTSWTRSSHVRREAADRLTELDALVATRTDEANVYRNAQISVENELHRLAALRPPCPTCGGSGRLANPEWITESYLCPDCVDGKVSIEQMAKLFNRVHFVREGLFPPGDLRTFAEGWEMAFNMLRQVGR